MKEITHKQAQSYLRLDLDELLSDAQRLDLQTHLARCEACRAESDSLSTLTSRLQSEFHGRWDAQDGPSQNVMTNVRSHTRRIAMSNKVRFGLRALAGVAALILLGFGLNYVILQLRDQSVTTSVAPIPGNFMPVAVPNADKRLLAFTMKKNGDTDIYTVRADGSDLTNLTGDSSGDNPYWSPDGKRIAFNRNQQVFVMDADGSNVIQLTEDGDLNRLVSFEEGREGGFDAWSPDGSKLIFVKLDFEQANTGGFMKLYVLEVGTKTQTPLTSEWGLFQSPVWSPDGEHIAFTAFIVNEQGEPTSMSVQVVGADGHNLVNLTASLPEDEPSFFGYWSNDGQSVFFDSYKISNETSKVYEAKLDGSLIELSQPTPGLLEWWDGTVLTVNSEDATLKWLRPDGTSSSLTVCPRTSDTMKISSTRSRAGILFFGAHCTRGEWSLYLSNKDGSTVQTLLDSPLSAGDGVMVDQAWSADDNYIAFNISSRSENTVEMFILDVVGTLNDPTLEPVRFDVGDIFSSVDSLSWQPIITEESLAEKSVLPYNGLIAFTSAAEDGNLDIYTVRSDGTELTNLTKNPAHDVDPYWSPDGKRIAFESDRNGFMQIFIMDTDGNNLIQLTGGEANHQFQGLGGEDYTPWSPDGSSLVYLERKPEGDQVIHTININERVAKPLFDESGMYSSISWSPDGSHIAYIVLSEDTVSPQIYIIDLNDGNTENITNLLPSDESLYSWNYAWTNEENIRFVAARSGWENNNSKFAVYEATLDGKTLTEIAKTSIPLEDWWEGTAFVRGFTGETLTWLRSDGTYSEFKPYENCQMDSEQHYFGFSRRSSTGYLLYAAGCPNGDLWLYWANPDGTDIRQLLASPIHAADGGLNNINWSLDGGHVTLTVNSSGITHLYILDVREALKSPLTPPEPLAIGGGDINYNISWQPLP